MRVMRDVSLDFDAQFSGQEIRTKVVQQYLGKESWESILGLRGCLFVLHCIITRWI